LKTEERLHRMGLARATIGRGLNDDAKKAHADSPPTAMVLCVERSYEVL